MEQLLGASEKVKLFVDDLRQCPPGWQIARTISAAIEWLARGVVVEVSLDHDIACRHHTCADRKKRHHAPRGLHLKICETDTFLAVAQYIALMPNRPKIRIHTANPAGGVRMAGWLGIEYDWYNYNPRDYVDTPGANDTI